LLNYNVQDQEYMDPSDRIGAARYDALYNAFNVDISGLAAGYSLHFDLYDRDLKRSVFAPFSHDAQSGSTVPVPDGGTTVALLGGAICALGAFRRRFMTK
jgi:hypothetical protein